MENAALELIDQIYHCATQPSEWPETLRRIVRSLGGGEAAIIPADHFRTDLSFWSDASSEAAQLFYGYWWRHSPFFEIDSGARSIVGEMSDRMYVSDLDIQAHPYYQDYLARFGVERETRIYLRPVPDLQVCFSVKRPRGAPAEPEDERDLRRLVSLHIARSLRLMTEVEAGHLMREGLVEICNRVACGVALLDGDGRVLFVNRAMKSIAKDGIEYRNGRLYTSLSGEQPGLERIIEQALPESRGPSGNAFVRLGRPSGKAPLLARAVGLSAQRRSRLGSSVGSEVLVLVCAEEDPMPDPSTILRGLGLTPAEARLAYRVGNGESPKTAAEALGVTVETARFVLKAIFAKLNLHSQSQLASFLTKISLLS